MTNHTLLSTIIVGLVSFTGACASTELGHTASPGGTVTAPQLDLVLEDTAARPSLPARIGPAANPALGHRLDNQVLVELDGRAETSVRLCIGGDGRVADVAMVKSSGLASLDDALIAQARSWRYQPLAMASASSCHAATIRYTVR